MTIKQLLTTYPFKLQKTSSSPILDVEILLSKVINKPKEFFYSNPEYQLTTTQLNNFIKLFNRRLKGEPVAYILGHKEFYGLDFKVTKDVLIPRPETEILVDEVIKFTRANHLTPFRTGIRHPKSDIQIADIGVGSGAIIISLAKNLCPPACPPKRERRGERSRRTNKFPQIRFYGTDISPKALIIAKQNAKSHNVFCHAEASRSIDKKPCITLLQGNLLQPLQSVISNLQSDLIITANLPYIKTKQLNNLKLKTEPQIALDGGSDGLKYYQEFFQQIKDFKLKPQAIFLEIGHNQASHIKKLIKQVLPAFKIKVIKDLCGFDRVLEIINSTTLA